MGIELADVNDGTVAQDMLNADQNFDIIEPYLDEIVAARDGEDSLLLKNTAQDTAIAALGGSPDAIDVLNTAALKQRFLL